MITCDQIINDAESLTTIVLTNVTSAVLTNSHNKKVRYKMDCYILQTVLLVIILLFIIVIICYHYAKHRSKLKTYRRANNVKWRIINLKKFAMQ